MPMIDPWALGEMASMIVDERRAEAERERLVRQARARCHSPRVAVAQVLRSLASRLDGDGAASRQPERRLVRA